MQKKIPMRQCVGCREMKPKKELIRWSNRRKARFPWTSGGRHRAGGAYLCPDSACLKRAIKSKALERALETAIPQEIYDGLLSRMEEGDHG